MNFHFLVGVDMSDLKQGDFNDSEIALLPYSSGTTGLTKGVRLTNRNIVANSLMQNADSGNGQLTYEAFGEHQDILPCVLPFFHIYGLTCCLLSKLAHGCKLITLNRFHPESFLNVLGNNKTSVLYLVPPIGRL